MAAALLMGGPSLAVAATGRWIKTGPGNSGIYETSSGYEEYMPSHSEMVQKRVAKDYVAPLPMNAAQQQTGARIVAAIHRVWQTDWV